MYGEFIKAIRIKKEISLREFCKQVEMDASNWSKIERGVSAPPQDEEKLKIYPNSPNGITGLETAFSLAYELLGLDKTLEKMAYNPRRILGINNKKMIKVALDEEWVVVPSQFKTKCKISPYKGMKLKGIIIND